MGKALICDRCNKVIRKYGDMNNIKINKYIGVSVVNELELISVDLCKECTETVLQYVNNEVKMVLYSPKEDSNELPFK